MANKANITATKEFACKHCGKKIQVNDNRRHMFCSVECRKAYYKAERQKAREATKRIVKCEICGKEFEVFGKSHKRFCSDECIKKHMVRYNADYISARRKVDEEFTQKNRELSRKSSSRDYARRQWNKWLSHADAILQLTEMDNARELIAKYLDLNLQARGDDNRRKNMVEGEKEATEMLESLGDLRSE